MKRDPYATTMTAFSKISDYLCQSYCDFFFNFINPALISTLLFTVHEEERSSEDIAELLHRSLSLDESPRNQRHNGVANHDSEENTMLVGSSDSSVEGYSIFAFFILLMLY